MLRPAGRRPGRIARLLFSWAWCLAAGAALATQPFQFGACIHLALERSDPETIARLASSIGLTSLRDDVYWSSVEREKGQFSLPPKLLRLREAFADADRQGGRPLAILSFGNTFYDGGGLIHSADGIEAFNRYTRFVIDQYADVVDQYEVWNEWNTGFGAKPKATYGDPVQYVRLLRSVHETIKARAPDATVVGGAVAGVDLKWIQGFIDAGGLDALDALSIHSYTLFRTFDVPEGAITSLQKVRGMLDAASPSRDIPILITEMGWPTNVGKYGVSEDRAADYLIRFMLMARAQRWIGGVWWYDLIDDGPSDNQMEHRFGLVRMNGVPKPAYHAAKRLAPILADGTDFSMHRSGLDTLIVRFDHKGAAWLVAWRVHGKAALWPTTMPDAPVAEQALADAVADLSDDGRPRFMVLKDDTWVTTQ